MSTVTIDYTPLLDGVPYDPSDEDGGVDSLVLTLPNQEPDDDPVVEAGPAVRVGPARYQFTFEQPPDGVYNATIEWREAADAEPFVDADEVLAFPLTSAPEAVPDGLVVGIDVVARKAGFTFPLSQAARDLVRQSIEEAQDDVQAYLGQPIVPQQHTDRGLWPNAGGWAFSQPRAGAVIEALPERYVDDSLTGTYTVTYLYGIDAAADQVYRPIVRYVTGHAAALARQDPQAKTAITGRSIRSVSVEGQSISFSDTIGSVDLDAQKVTGGMGALPTLSSLSRWRLSGRRVFQRSTC